MSNFSSEDQLLVQALAPVAVPAEIRRRLVAQGCVVHLRPGPIAPGTPGLPPRAWWLLRQGQVAVGEHDARGRFAERWRAGPGDWVDVFGALGQAPGWFHDLVAMGPCELLALPQRAVLQAMLQDPAAERAFGAVLAGAARALRDGLSDARRLGVSARLARRILDETADDGQAAPRPVWQLGLRKQHLAQQLGVSLETLSRTFRDLRDEGIVEVQGYAIRIQDRPALEAISRLGRRTPWERARAEPADRRARAAPARPLTAAASEPPPTPRAALALRPALALLPAAPLPQ